jgi:uncharacterized membrane protein
MHVKSWGHAFFAATMIALGIMGLVNGELTPVWQLPKSAAPAKEALTYLCGLISLGCGLGLLWQRTAAIASCVLFAYLLLWLLVFRVPYVFLQSPKLLVLWNCSSTAVMVAAAWVLYVWFDRDRDSKRLRFATGENGLRIARTLYGLALIPFGLAHFVYLKETVVLISNWPAPAAWAYFTGGAFIAAGLAMIVGVLAQLAATLSTLQLGLFALIVWVPRVAAGEVNDFQWGEAVITVALTAAAWVVADSYRGMPWLAIGKR